VPVWGDAPHSIPRRRGIRRRRCARSIEAACPALRPRLAAADRPTAVFALSDTVAYGAYEACRAARLAVPTDLSVVGFDDLPVSSLLDPPLTAVSWDTEGAAVAAVEAVARAIDGATGPSRLPIAARLVVRGSTA